MSESFNPYREWLGIDNADAAPNHYQLLGIQPFESDLFVIKNAANSRRYSVQSHQDGPHGDEARRLLGELDQAEICLFDRDRRAQYDAELNQQLRAKSNLDPPWPAESGGAAANGAESATPSSPAVAKRPDEFLPPAGSSAPQAAPKSPADFLPPTATPVAQPPQGSSPPPPPSHDYYQPPAPTAIPTAQPVASNPPPAAAPAQFAGSQTPVAQPPAAMSPNQFATAQPTPQAGAAPMAAPAALPASAIPTAAPAAYAQASAAIPVASSVAQPAAVPAASPASFSQQPAAEPARTNVVGERRSARRRRKSSSLLMTAGAPAAGVLVLGLMILYFGEMGPFASRDDQTVSQNTVARPQRRL